MKVREVIEKLQKYDGELDVFVPRHSFAGDIESIKLSKKTVYRETEDGFPYQTLEGVSIW